MEKARSYGRLEPRLQSLLQRVSFEPLTEAAGDIEVGSMSEDAIFRLTASLKEVESLLAMGEPLHPVLGRPAGSC